MPPIQIRSTAEIAEKFIAVTPGRAAEYARGVRDPNVDWESAAKAAEDNYNKGVQAAIVRKAFGSGVTRAGNTAWREGAAGKGVDRWPAGVAASKAKYEAGFAPFREVLAGLTLPARGPAGSPGNIARVAAVAEALHQRKLSL